MRTYYKLEFTDYKELGKLEEKFYSLEEAQKALEATCHKYPDTCIKINKYTEEDPLGWFITCEKYDKDLNEILTIA